MKKWYALGLALLLWGCVSLPTIEPMDAVSLAGLEADCRSHFPRGRWQLVHTLTARFPGGRQATFTGVVVLSSVDRSLHCVLMTIEGMVLFEAGYDGREISVSRAFGPFDNPHFAQGVMEDIRFLFFAPKGEMIAGGALDNGDGVCRYHGAAQTLIDLSEFTDGKWAMHQYDGRGRILRCVTADATDKEGIAPRMDLDAGNGFGSYHLSLELIQAIKRP